MIPGWINCGTRFAPPPFCFLSLGITDGSHMTHCPTGQELWKVLQRGAVEPEEGIPASQGQDPRVQHPHRRGEQDGR